MSTYRTKRLFAGRPAAVGDDVIVAASKHNGMKGETCLRAGKVVMISSSNDLPYIQDLTDKPRDSNGRPTTIAGGHTFVTTSTVAEVEAMPIGSWTWPLPAPVVYMGGEIVEPCTGAAPREATLDRDVGMHHVPVDAWASLVELLNTREPFKSDARGEHPLDTAVRYLRRINEFGDRAVMAEKVHLILVEFHMGGEGLLQRLEAVMLHVDLSEQAKAGIRRTAEAVEFYEGLLSLKPKAIEALRHMLSASTWKVERIVPEPAVTRTLDPGDPPDPAGMVWRRKGGADHVATVAHVSLNSGRSYPSVVEWSTARQQWMTCCHQATVENTLKDTVAYLLERLAKAAPQTMTPTPEPPVVNSEWAYPKGSPPRYFKVVIVEVDHVRCVDLATPYNYWNYSLENWYHDVASGRIAPRTT